MSTRWSIPSIQRWPGALLRAVLLLAVGVSASANAQNTHELKLGREAAFFGVGLALHASGYMLGLGDPTDAPWHNPVLLDRSTVIGFNRISTYKWSPSADHASNILFASAAVVSLAGTMLQQHGDQPLLPLAVMGEAVWLSSGLTGLVKELVRRPRPYIYNPDAPEGLRSDREGYVSFWSGHTANCAAITFCAAGMLQQSDMSPSGKTAVWIGAAALPAAMGFLRIRAGQHFPTDVLVGYGVGALIGWGTAYFHRAEKSPASP